MNTFKLPRRLRHLLAGATLLSVLDLAAPAALAGPPQASFVNLSTRAGLFFSSLLTEVLNDRTRLIQASVFIVALGIAILWWRK
jgi:hypothetical protein